MPVEEATYIHELNPNYPQGTGEPKSLGDDHMRLIKSTVQATFPNVAGVVSASHTQLSTLNEGTLPACNGSALTNLNGSNISSGTVADARLSSNVPLKDALNTFTGAGMIIANNGGPIFRLSDTDATSGARNFRIRSTSATFQIASELDNTNQGEVFLQATVNGSSEVTALALAADAITLNGVNVTDYARLSQAIEFTGQTLTLTGTNATLRASGTATGRLLAEDTGAGTNEKIWELRSDGGTLSIRTQQDNDGAGSNAMTFSRSGTTVTGVSVAVAITAPTIAQSTSTTLAAGQVHAIDGNATLPNMAAGQWVTVINNGSSARTVTKNGSDTMYWTATGSSVTSVTIPARGSATFICADGSNVYASGTVSGAS